MSKSAEKILSTAETLFNQSSFVAVGVDLIRDQSGCSKTTMYTYFKNKQQLIAQVLRQRDARFRDALQQAVGGVSGIAALEKIYDWHTQWFQADHFKGCLFIRAFAESTPQDIETRSIVHAHKTWMRQLIEQHSLALKASVDISALFFLILEGLISQFLLQGFDHQVAATTKSTLFNCIQLLENSAVR